MGVGVADTFIDSMATDGTTRKGLNLANAFYCQANNYGSMNKILKFHNVQVADDRATMEGLIFNEGAMVGGTFAGDVFITSYWGVSVLLNSGGFTNGVGGGNNGRSYEPGYSAFTINMRSSTTQTTFDRRLFTVMPDGNTTINGTLIISNNLTVNGDLYLKNGTWHRSAEGVYRLYYGANEISYYCCGANGTDGHIFMNSGYSHVLKIKIMMIYYVIIK
jgi:hypothetical protein